MNTFLVFFVIFVSAKVWSFVSVVTAARTHTRTGSLRPFPCSASAICFVGFKLHPSTLTYYLSGNRGARFTFSLFSFLPTGNSSLKHDIHTKGQKPPNSAISWISQNNRSCIGRTQSKKRSISSIPETLHRQPYAQK